jgi:hypothetical protein
VDWRGVRSIGMSRSGRPIRPSRLAGSGLAILVAALVAACSAISQTPPAPTPADFPGVAGVLAQHGIQVDHIVSGDSGCPDPKMAKTAIAFDASGLDQTTRVRVYIYIFRNRATYERLRSTVDGCARGYVTDPATFESVETSPYVLAGQGPWGASFKTNLRAAITEAAGTGN